MNSLFKDKINVTLKIGVLSSELLIEVNIENLKPITVRKIKINTFINIHSKQANLVKYIVLNVFYPFGFLRGLLWEQTLARDRLPHQPQGRQQ